MTHAGRVRRRRRTRIGRASAGPGAVAGPAIHPDGGSEPRSRRCPSTMVRPCRSAVADDSAGSRGSARPGAPAGSGGPACPDDPAGSRRSARSGGPAGRTRSTKRSTCRPATWPPPRPPRHCRPARRRWPAIRCRARPVARSRDCIAGVHGPRYGIRPHRDRHRRRRVNLDDPVDARTAGRTDTRDAGPAGRLARLRNRLTAGRSRR